MKNCLFIGKNENCKFCMRCNKDVCNSNSGDFIYKNEELLSNMNEIQRKMYELGFQLCQYSNDVLFYRQDNELKYKIHCALSDKWITRF
jgi:hypothetical protein